MSFVIDSPRWFGKYAVALPDGTLIHCHNLATARKICCEYNENHQSQ